MEISMAKGSITQISDNKHRIRYDLPRGVDGRRKQKTETVYGDREQADKRLAEVNCEIIRSQQMTIAEYLDHWVWNYADTSVRPRTLRGYNTIIRNHLKKNFGSMFLKDLEAHHVREYYSQCIQSGLSAQTVLHIHRLFRQALKQAVSWNMLLRNVLDDVAPPMTNRPEIRILTPEEINVLLETAKGTDFFLPIHLGIFTGMRRSEVLGLQFRDVNLEAQTLKVSRTMVDIPGDQAHMDVPKSLQSRRTIPFGEETADLLRLRCRALTPHLEALDRRLTATTQVCLRSNGSILTPDALTKSFKKITIQCGLEGVRFRDLRHTYTSSLTTTDNC